ncbi:MAG: beta-galactosidase trimerization domain-containing protein [Kiritimatiellae bacterium]|nr:beta-galactosidase trimerization domain-containing protein [Kiritimatiellia bacterium]
MAHRPFSVNSVVIALLLVCSRFPATAADDPAAALRMRHSAAGKMLDKLYYDAGTRVDIVAFDLKELMRQGRKGMEPLLTQAETHGRDMRKRWVALDERRAVMFSDLCSTPLTGNTMVRIELTDDSYGYLSVSAVTLAWPDGTKMEIAPSAFRGGKPDPNPRMRIILNRASLANVAAAGIEFPGGSNLPAFSEGGTTSLVDIAVTGIEIPSEPKRQAFPEGDATLTVTASDAYAPGRNMRISLGRQTLLDGASPFAAKPSRHVMTVPAAAFRDGGPPGSIWEAMPGLLDALETDSRAFGEWSSGIADRIEQATADARKGLVYKPCDYPRDWWRDHFIRGICFHSDTLSYPERHDFEPWNYHNYEYVAKALHDAGINLVYAYAFWESQEAFLGELNKVGIPYLQCAWDHSPSPEKRSAKGRWSAPIFPEDHYNGDYGRKGLWSISAIKNFGDSEQRIRDALTFAARYSGGNPSFRGISIDEPVIVDDSGRTRGREYPEVSNVAGYTNVTKAFQEYLESRKEYLKKAGIAVPSEARPITIAGTTADLPLWMEWQMFKKTFMADSYRALSDAMAEAGYVTLPVIMNTEPQKGSYVSMASKLPMVATDLYADGSLGESMSMQLLRHAAGNKAYMVTGAGYSCKTPATFRRSLAISMMHSDGNIQWIYDYAAKYRDPFSFRKGDRPGSFSRDDRSRYTFQNWRPQYWDIQVEMLGKMRQADAWLNNTTSAATVAIVTCERLGIAMSAGSKVFPNFPQRGYEIGMLHRWLLQRNRPLDIRFLEATTAEALKRYKVIVLHDERVMTPAEAGRISDWVKAGGTLIATGETSLYDEWARRQGDFAMADLFGVHYLGTTPGAKHFAMQESGKIVNYAANRAYVKVKPSAGATIAGAWDTGDPAMVVHRMGKGASYYLSLKSISKASEELADVGSLLRKLVDEHAPDDPVSVLNAPRELEVQIRRKGECYVVHLLDWSDEERTVEGLKLKMNRTGTWRAAPAFGPQTATNVAGGMELTLRPLRQYDIIVLTPEK